MPTKTRNLTPTEREIVAILADGQIHAKSEFYSVLQDSDLTYDENPNKSGALAVHITSIRKILRPIGQDIVFVVRGWKHGYQHIRLLKNPTTGE